MLKHQGLFLKSLIAALVAAAAGGGASRAGATTLSYWRFEGDGVTTPTDGTFVRDTNGRTALQPDGIQVLDSSGNGNTLYTWDNNTTGHQYRPNVPAATLRSGLPNSWSVQNNGGFPATFTWSAQSLPSNDLEPIKPLAWTIEASINSTNIGSNRTFVGRDGNRDVGAADANRAPLYFKTFNGTLQILFTDEAGNNYDLSDPTGPIALNTWYNVAAVSDGTTLSLYKDAGAGYQLVNSMALTPGDTRLNYDDDGSTTAGDAQWGWTVGRGRYSGATGQGDGHTDRWFGLIDEVRISDVALTPDQFLFLPSPKLTLVVNKVNGQVVIRNTSTSDITIDYYQVNSPDPAGAPPGGALSVTGWNSLSDQNIDAAAPPADFNGNGAVDAADLADWRADFGVSPDADADGDGDSDGNDFLEWQRQLGETGGGPGDSWDEADMSSNEVLAELFLNGATTIPAGGQLSLGAAFNPAVFGSGVDGNLTFRFGIQGEGALTDGGVQYVTTGPITAVPEPSTLLCAASGVFALLKRWGTYFRK